MNRAGREAELAAEFVDARRTATPIEMPSVRFPDLGWDTARRVARETDRLMSGDGGTQIGWKLGWTSAEMRQALGVDRPNWGTLWRHQECTDELSLADYIHPKAEPELVWKAPTAIARPMSADELAVAGGEWAVAIEIVDPRFPSFSFTSLDNTADNSSASGWTVGEFRSVSDPSALDDLTVAFGDGREMRTGMGRAAMDSQWQALAWLTRSLDHEGLAIEAGQIVLTGGLTAPFDLTDGSTYQVSAPGFGSVTLRVRR